MIKKIFIFILLFNSFTFFINANFVKEDIILQNTKVKKQYNTIFDFLIKKSNSKDIYLQQDFKNNIYNLLLKIKDYFILLDENVTTKNKIEGLKNLSEIKLNFNQIINILKNSVLKIGEITYYNNIFEGKHTANGNIFSNDYFSAANCNTEFNKLIQVISKDKSVIVKTNDRPNCKKFPFIIDLSTIAFDVLAKRSTGRQNCEYLELGQVDTNYYKKYLELNSFKDFGIFLDENIPNTYLQNEIVKIKGNTVLNYSSLNFKITDPNGNIHNFNVNIDENKKFELYFIAEIKGKYIISIEDTNINSNNFLEIYSFGEDLFLNKKLLKYSDIQSLSTLDIKKNQIGSNNIIYKINNINENYNKIILQQNSHIIELSAMGDIIIPENNLSIFDFEKEINILIKSYKTNTKFSHDYYTEPTNIFEGKYLLKNLYI